MLGREVKPRKSYPTWPSLSFAVQGTERVTEGIDRGQRKVTGSM
jgi:hypothetical protein